MKLHYTFFISIPVMLLTSWGVTHAAIGQTFGEYKDDSKRYCEDPLREWEQQKVSNVVPKVDYPELSAPAINNFIKTERENKNISDAERARLQQELSESRMGGFAGYKSLEAARVVYRARMNTLFTCAILDSRIRSIKDVQDVIKKRVKIKPDEITQALDKEATKLQSISTKLKCNPPKPEQGIDPMATLKDTAAKQYCRYRYYLGYLESNLYVDLYNIKQIESKVGAGGSISYPANVGQWNESFGAYNKISEEIARATTTLPIALRSYVEMQQSYPTHILLLLIYDDFIRLREQLSRYMNASSQLYQKAFNAQDKNNR